jgi:gliding motility-associated-like protein
MHFKSLFIFFTFLLVTHFAFAQCPPNIGFEDGTFKNWKCYTGTLIKDIGGESVPVEGPAIPGRHTILTNKSPQDLDPYGHFPINSPNNSLYSIMLGGPETSGNRSPATYERITYDFTVPSDDYTLIYYYALVFQDAGHPAAIQPKFYANVINLDNPGDQSCGQFYFKAKVGTDGFKQSDADASVYYKPWAPLTVKFTGKKGKKFQLEFITEDCSQGAHFGYAYLDFNESNCESPITGNQYCVGQNVITLTAPSGFQNYSWTDAGGDVKSTGPTLSIPQPFPPDGTQYNLHIVPYAGLGCENAFTTTIQKNNEAYNLAVHDPPGACKIDGINITLPSVTTGSSPGMKFEYYTDPEGQTFVSDPKHVTQTGDYYIRGTNPYGCTDIAKIHVDLFEGAVLKLNRPKPVCFPATVDLRNAVTTDEPGVVYTYFSDVNLSKPILNPQAINKTGTYYVKATTAGVPCVAVQPVDVIVSPLPTISAPIAYASCPPLNLNLAIATLGDSGGNVSYKFYSDAQGTTPITEPAAVMTSGAYYYRKINEYGCESTALGRIDATVNPAPTFNVTEPEAVMFPQIVNLRFTHIPLTYATFTYWLDSTATKPLIDFETVDKTGTYYIKATSLFGCVVINHVHVTVNAPPEANLLAPNTFTPNGDGINDDFRPATEGVFKLNYIKIFNRYGKEVYETKQSYNRWDGSLNGKPEPAGTYYWVFNAYDIYRKRIINKTGSITIIR